MGKGLFVLFISTVSSTVGAISGIGGGVIIKPVFDMAGIGDAVEVSFLAGCTVLVMSVVSLLRCRKSGINIDISVSPWLAAGSAAGGVAGKLAFSALSAALSNRSGILAVQSALLMLLASGVLAYMFFKSCIVPHRNRRRAVSVGIGLFLGGLSAFLGIGGGPMNIIVLYYIFSMTAKEATLNSLFIIFVSQTSSLLYTVAENKVPSVDILSLAFMAIGGASGALIGSHFLKKLPAGFVERLYTAVIMLVFCTSLYNLVCAIA